MQGLCCYTGFSLVTASWGYSPVLIVVTTHCRAQAQWLWHMGLVAPQHVGSSRTKDQTCVSYIGRQIPYHWATREVLYIYLLTIWSSYLQTVFSHFPNIYIYIFSIAYLGFPDGTSCKESTYQCRWHKRCEFDPWMRKIPWRRAWQPTPVFLSGESHGQRSLASYNPWSRKESDMTGD